LTGLKEVPGKYSGRLYKVRSLAVLWRIWELYSAGQLDVRLADGSQIPLILPILINPPDHPTSPLTANFSQLYGLPANAYMERVPALQLMQGELILGYAPTSLLNENLNAGMLAECTGFLDPPTGNTRDSGRMLAAPLPVTLRR